MTIRVLLVDDHPLVCQALGLLLERESGFDVVGEAHSGLDAVREVERVHPDVVLMDVSMQEMNGIEATRQILERHPKVRVIALSSYTDRHYVNGMLGRGACGYVLKTNAYDELCEAIHAAAAGQRYVCSEVAGMGIEDPSRQPLQPSVYVLLAPREREVLQLIAEGLTSAAIAGRLSLSPSTVETHRRNLMRKLDLHNVADLTRYAIREGLTTADR